MGSLLKSTLFLISFLLVATSVEPFLFNLLPFFKPPLALPLLQPPAKAEKGIRTTVENQNGGGSWELIKENSGVSAMHLVILRNNKAVFFDASVTGPSLLPLPKGQCRVDTRTKKEDCWAHGVEMDLNTYDMRPLKVITDTWCSSGAFDEDGNLVQAGGWNDGGNAVRILSPCDNCNWNENPKGLAVQRWYSSQQVLPDGRFIIIGGRRQMNYEFLPPPGQSNKVTYDLPLLQQTTDDVENNLYPFVHLLPDGNLFVFANNRSILLDPRTNKVVKEFPILNGGSRNYPASGLSALLPIDLNRQGRKGRPINVEVLICGGAPHNAAKLAAAKNRVFLGALRSCGRITVTKPNPTWRVEVMPTPRVMGDILLLPNAEVLILNGARRGSAGWYWGAEPNLEPVLYRPRGPRNERFVTLTPATIPRMYHSSSAVLPDTSILVAGSNPIPTYNITLGPGNPYPTEVRLEKFYPPYMNSNNDVLRPTIISESAPADVKYGQTFTLDFTSRTGMMTGEIDLMVTMYTPPFTTHAVSMNQRLLILKMKGWEYLSGSTYRVAVSAPPSPELAPAGYYMVFVVSHGVPSHSVWIKVHK
ncbi:hypothetical protein J5N97_007771 [Dioscorea zingiberensis]|uniref:Uncharacterized protein n=1 Tax=Dioscorea zingiberensis TaxID=325984 RepID=A0A9D5HTZ5_9LILI|nr:hypothetical protein J5N97_007771 [Dioscorea zingiberensis]